MYAWPFAFHVFRTFRLPSLVLVPSLRSAKNYILFYCRVKVMLRLLFGPIKSKVALFLQTQSAPTFWEVHSDFIISNITGQLLRLQVTRWISAMSRWGIKQSAGIFFSSFFFSIKVAGVNPSPQSPTPLVTALPF